MDKKLEDENSELNDLNIYKLLRLSKGWSTTKLAAMSGISQNYVSQIENGVRTPSREIKEKLAKALDVSVKLFDAFEFPEKGPRFFERAMLKILKMLVTE